MNSWAETSPAPVHEREEKEEATAGGSQWSLPPVGVPPRLRGRRGAKEAQKKKKKKRRARLTSGSLS